MVDNLTPPSSESEPKRRYFSTSAGRVVVIALALGVLLVVAGVAAVVVLNFRSAASSETTTESTAPSGSRLSSATPVEETPTPAPPVPGTAVFTFRDPFRAPPQKVESTESANSTTTAGNGGGGDTSSASQLDPKTLYLQDVVSVNDEPKAVLALKGNMYTLGEGERIPDSPWQVLEVRDDAVTMLYGDSQVVLSVGQGLQK